MSGWNYNLTKRCVKSTLPSLPNYYEDVQQCESGPFPNQTTGLWTVAVESERDFGVACPEPKNQSFLINGLGSPVTLGWLPHTDENGQQNWSVNLKTNLHDVSHPCGAGYFTWYMFMDHADHGGGPFPIPDHVRFSANVNYNDFCPNGAARALAMFKGYWNGKSRDIELHFQSTNWGDAEPGNPVIVSRMETDTFQYLAIHGEYFGITVPKSQDVLLTVNWHSIINTLISLGYLPAPSNGWSTRAIGIGHEAHNWMPDLSVITDLWFTNFRVDSI